MIASLSPHELNLPLDPSLHLSMVKLLHLPLTQLNMCCGQPLHLPLGLMPDLILNQPLFASADAPSIGSAIESVSESVTAPAFR